MYTIEDVTAIVAYYNTPNLLNTLISTLRSFYDIPIIIIDNSTIPYNRKYADTLACQFKNITVKHMNENTGHAGGINEGVRLSKTRLVMVIDSDVIFKKKGIVEEWLCSMKPFLYGVGRIRKINKFGINAPVDSKKDIPYLHPHLMLLNKQMFYKFPPALDHGAPMIKTMKALFAYQIKNNKSLLAHVWGSEYYEHLKRGTRKKKWQDTKLFR